MNPKHIPEQGPHPVYTQALMTTQAKGVPQVDVPSVMLLRHGTHVVWSAVRVSAAAAHWRRFRLHLHRRHCVVVGISISCALITVAMLERRRLRVADPATGACAQHCSAE